MRLPTAILAVAVAVVAVALAACGTTTGPTAEPSGAPTAPPSVTPSSAPNATASPTATSQPSPSLSQSATPPSTPSPSPLALRWVGGTVVPGTPDSALTDVAVLEGTLVAVGLADFATGGAWVSEDGVDWTPIERDVFAGVGLAAVAATEAGLVAVGRELHTESDVAAVLRSTDGREWAREEGGAALEGGQMIDVAVYSDGLVAVGSAPGSDSAAIWLAPGGGGWERVPDAPTLQEAFMWTVTATRRGLIAGGWRREGEPSAAIWTSTDGRTWSLAPSIQDGSGMQIRSVVESASGYVAVGERVEGGQAAAWTSEDGGTWRRVNATSFAGASLVAVAVTDLGLVAVGGHDLDDAGVWVSADGTRWDRVEDPVLDGAFLTSVTGFAGRLVAVGVTQVPLGDTGSYDVRAGAWATRP